ncbi:MAG: response regulator [Pirellulales bacterium]
MASPKVVMHVDDDQAMLRLVERSLVRSGYEVVSVQDPLQALAELKRSNARVVLLDIDMPGKDGLTLLQEIKQFDGGIQVIMVTGMVSMGTVLRSTTMGAEGCIFKPISDMQQIIDAVDRAFTKIHGWWEALHNWMLRRYGARGKRVFEAEAAELGIDLESSPAIVALHATPVLNEPTGIS